MGKTLDITDRLGFTDQEIEECLKSRGLLSIELEFTKRCNLKCLYCYSGAGNASENELDRSELKSVITQAENLGAKKVVLLGGGEPLLYSGLTDIIDYISSLGMQQALFTNGVLLSKSMAQFLFAREVSVVIKSNSMKPEVQDMLAGVSGAFGHIREGLGHLMSAGYPGEKAFLGIQTVICRQNIDELPLMWTWARENGIVPYFEMLTLQGRAKENPGLEVSKPEVRAIFERLEEIDREISGIPSWPARPTIAAFSCKRHLYSCLINSQGFVQPCTGVDMAIGNIRETPLDKILKESPVIKDLRNIYEKIEGSCGACEYRCDCYGCRGNAYQITGNYLASDPTCWRACLLYEDSADLRK
jgi:MoaA/NifB/PqqE/SkfB family radical SAM enzyme